VPDNTLYYGDNLDILRRYVADESVDLVYLDPPFNGNANYNVLFKEHSGEQATSQILAFEDTWTRSMDRVTTARRSASRGLCESDRRRTAGTGPRGRER